MRWPLYLLLVPTTWVSTGLAQDADTLAAIASIPSCAQLCLVTSAIDSPCQPTNTTCVCANAQVQSAAEKCVLSSCTLKESLTTKNITSNLCHAPFRSENTHLRVANIVLAAVTASCIVLRFGYQAFFHVTGLSKDDYLVVATVLMAIPSVIIVIRGLIPNGIGLDIWHVPFDHIEKFVQWLYVVTLLYIVQAALVKATLLMFFLRIFPRRQTVQVLWGTVIFIGLWTVAFLIPAAMPCMPVSNFWEEWWDQAKPTKCFHMDALIWWHAIIGMVLDIWMLCIPLYEVYHLQMKWLKKVGVGVMFSLGIFVTVVSALRLKSLFIFDRDQNITWKHGHVVLWSLYELHVGVLCACIPTLRLILIHALPSLISSIQNSTQRSTGNEIGVRSRGGNENTDMMKSGKSGRKSLVPEPNTITHTQTFAVHHEEEDDEIELVHMESPGNKATRERGDSYTSEFSV